MKQRSELYLKDILDAIERIKTYTANSNLKDLQTDRKTLDSVLMNFLIIGEAASQMPDTIKEKYTEVPWSDIKRFRNVVVHKYWSVEIKAVWMIIQDRLETLKQQIEQIITKENIEF
ncbi:MAG TPA: DUF86 domain-containing protein [Candidatus Nanoarchaeia archaeon]|nr:DUF86 domain-containing protein [Candidatus Nanoarchaeia archaeon]